MMRVFFIFVFSLINILSSSYAGQLAVEDFCVADYNAPTSASGYSCKPVASVTADDFAYSGLAVAGNTSNIAGVALTRADATMFPGLNGLGLSMARVDFAPGGVAPIHTHHGTDETLIVIEGTILAVFISADQNKVYMKTIKAGDIWVTPQGLMHFFVNIGGDDKQALAFASYNNARLHVQSVAATLFGNDLPAQLVADTTFISLPEIIRLKALGVPKD